MKYLPIFLNLSAKKCLVVGAGGIAARKIELLLKAQAIVNVVAAEIGHSVRLMADQALINCSQRAFEDVDLDDKVLVIAASNDKLLNAHISQLAAAKNIPVNIVDNSDLCSFIMPSIVDRNPVQIAISTGGSSPVLARLLRSKIETSIPSAYGELAILVDGYRDKVKTALANVDARRKFWEMVLEGQVAELVFNHQYCAAESLLAELLQIATDNRELAVSGEVYLIGTGAGDADQLTLKALRLMQKSDVVFYSQDIPPKIIDLVRRDAEKILFKGETVDSNYGTGDINQLIGQLTKRGKRVLRLVGGDSQEFERVALEAGELFAGEVSLRVLPGVASADYDSWV